MPQHPWDEEPNDEEYAREIKALLETYAHHTWTLEYELAHYICMLRSMHITRRQPTIPDLLRQYCDAVIAEARADFAALDPRLLRYLDESVLFDEEDEEEQS